MKADQVRSKIQAKVETPASKVLDGEVLEPINPTLVSMEELGLDEPPDDPAYSSSDEDEQYSTDLEYAIHLLNQTKELLMYLANDKLTHVIEDPDRKEMRRSITEIRVFVDAVGVKPDDFNVGKCKHFLYSSCIKAKLSARTMCGMCKQYKLKKRMAKAGLVPDKATLSEREVKILENIQKTLEARGETI